MELESTARNARSLLPRLLVLSAAALTMACAWASVSRIHHQRRIERPKALPERVQVWEDEGGQNQMAELPPP